MSRFESRAEAEFDRRGCPRPPLTCFNCGDTREDVRPTACGDLCDECRPLFICECGKTLVSAGPASYCATCDAPCAHGLPLSACPAC